MCTLITALALVLRYYQRYPLFSRGCFVSLQNSRVLTCSSGVSLSNSIVLPPLNAFIGFLALELDYIMLNFSKREDSNFFCSAGKKSDGTVRIDITIKGYEEYYPHGSYQFFGSCTDFPFEELQSIVRKYDVPSWNGWDKSAENYNECEWFQIEFGYESEENICAMGTLYPNDYENVQAELLSVVVNFIERYNDGFIPWKG